MLGMLQQVNFISYLCHKWIFKFKVQISDKEFKITQENSSLLLPAFGFNALGHNTLFLEILSFITNACNKYLRNNQSLAWGKHYKIIISKITQSCLFLNLHVWQNCWKRLHNLLCTVADNCHYPWNETIFAIHM